jgi:dihydrofolate synthase/folylpolyglutamate synthase
MSNFNSDSLDAWLSWLETLHPKTIELGLDRIRIVADKLDLFSKLQQSQIKIITVAGTNGKGTCVAALQAFLLKANKSVGAYTSPHLLRYNERVQINGRDVSNEKLVEAFKRIEAVRGNVSLSYFEYGTLATFLLFLAAKLDFWILEVGLGGRLDAVNLLDADIAIVTSIDLDHQDWLGDDREKIGFEKAGVYRSSRPAICVDPHPPTSLLEYSAHINADLLMVNRDIAWRIHNDSWQWQGRDGAHNKIVRGSIPLTHLPLPSISAALQTLVLLDIYLSDTQVRKLIADLQLPGRCQKIQRDGRQLILDVAHNPAAVKYLAKQLDHLAPEKANTVAVFAVMADKDIQSMVESISDQFSSWYIAGLPIISRAASSASLAAILTEQSLSHQLCATVPEAIEQAIVNTQPGDRIVVFGSFYTVAEGLQWLNIPQNAEVNDG